MRAQFHHVKPKNSLPRLVLWLGICGLGFAQPKAVLAQLPFPAVQDPPGFKFSNALVGTTVGNVIPYIFGAAGLASLVFIIWAGFQYLLSQGNPKQIEEARNKLTQAIVGFLIVFASYWLVQILEKVLGVKIVSV